MSTACLSDSTSYAVNKFEHVGGWGGAVQLNKFEYVQGDRTLYTEVQVEQVQTCRGRQTDTIER